MECVKKAYRISVRDVNKGGSVMLVAFKELYLLLLLLLHLLLK